MKTLRLLTAKFEGNPPVTVDALRTIFLSSKSREIPSPLTQQSLGDQYG
ncbi:hypothetical protein PhaeoP83_01632 [Phaeobacter inhibens]|uniref:Uncharacterized protein n=1 Tax=Phaeobacter inhibens TaxID=221822 RepID=A0ABM6RDH7_9RHOB|nr:hypothetical protein PhaeoP83_01632 [Phaeobacter inhibens]AUQ94462.1 hypothetical protein PhaeoP66_01679 [Phaeobacter inhibens]AUR19712.1 hypothetical protein PhaeoP80_01632 [Phaeobacter inhibens]